MAAAIQPIIGMFIMAMLTALHAETAESLNAPKLTEAMPAKVADAPPVVTSESRNAPRAFIPLHIPAVEKRSRAMVQRPMLPMKPRDMPFASAVVSLISAMLTAAVRAIVATRPRAAA